MAKIEAEPVKLETYFNNYIDDDDDDNEVKVVVEKKNDTKNNFDDYTDDYENFNKVNEDVEKKVVEKENKNTTKTTNYSKVQKHKSYKEVYKELDKVDDDYEAAKVNGILSFISNLFSIIGVIIAIILIAYFITTGQFQNLILYILGLIVAFFFGWFFMYFLVLFTENN